MANINPLTSINYRWNTRVVDAYKEVIHKRAVFTGLAQALSSIQTHEEFRSWTDKPSLDNELDMAIAGRSLEAANESLEIMHHNIATSLQCGVHPSSAIWCGYNWGVLMLGREHLLDVAFLPFIDLYIVPRFHYDEGEVTPL